MAVDGCNMLVLLQRVWGTRGARGGRWGAGRAWRSATAPPPAATQTTSSGWRSSSGGGTGWPASWPLGCNQHHQTTLIPEKWSLLELSKYIFCRRMIFYRRTLPWIFEIKYISDIRFFIFYYWILGMIQKLRNPFLRHFSLGTPPFPLHNFLADQWVVLWRLCNSWTSK